MLAVHDKRIADAVGRLGAENAQHAAQIGVLEATNAAAAKSLTPADGEQAQQN